MSAATDLSAGLQGLVDSFTPHQDEPEGINIEPAELRKLIQVLQIMQSIAANLEIEVRCLRDMEASGEAHAAMEDEATGQLSDLLCEIDGKVIRPNFGRRT